ncbi:MAG: hypothetical protein ACOYU3_10390 [Bacillota bacterium]
MKMRAILALTLMLVFILSGCSGPPVPSPTQPSQSSGQPSPPQLSQSADQSGFSRETGDFPLGDNAKWPEYIPDDIPPIPGDITMVMADKYQIRIFFNNLPKNEFEAYLHLLEQNGFSLQFVVYEQAGMPAGNVEELIRQGKYDAVRITKGSYNMSIEYGGNEGTYDMDPKGFPEGTMN